MKNIRKITLFIVLLLIATFISPIFSNAETKQVSTEQDLIDAVNNAQNGDVIELTTNIVLTKPLEIKNKNITIDGKGNTVSKVSEGWTPDGKNSSLITAGLTGTKLTLMNMTLKDAEKYGVQSYDGAYVILDNVTLTNNGYGGVLINSGSVEVRNVTLNRNGNPNNNGIEIAKGDGVYTDGTRPELIMNGTLTSTETENVIYVDIVDPSNGFEIRNTDTSKNKVFVNGNKLVVTDENNDIIFQSSEITGLTVTGDVYVENVTITVKLNDKTTTFTIQKGSKLTKEIAMSKIDLASLELANYTIDGFYSDSELTKEFDFESAISEDTVIYAKLSNKNQPVGGITNQGAIDTTPKTGIDNVLTIVSTIFVISIVALAIFTRKEK